MFADWYAELSLATFLLMSARVNRPQIMTWGGRIFTLYLNYVTGYTSPLLFLFERTHNYPVDDQGLLLWQSVVWAGPKFVLSNM